ncbi:type IV secretory system conjugative DNA transfer family protein [Larkinella ripae]
MDTGSVQLGYESTEPKRRGPHEILGFRSSRHQPVPETPAPEGIFYDGTAHLMTIAATGAGKGRGVVIPTLLTYPGSVVVLDPKGENYQVTARARREMGQRVIRLNPFDINGPETDALNMLDLFKLPNTDVETEAQMLAELFSNGSRGTREPFWDLTACMLLAGVIGYVVTILPPEERTLQSIRKVLFSNSVDYDIAVILDTHGKNLPRATYHQLAAYLSMPERETRPSVLATVNAYLSPLLSEQVTEVTSLSSFSLLDFRAGEPISIYIILPPDKIKSHRALIKVWVGVLLRAVTSRESIPELQTLFLLDEAGQLGNFTYLQSIITLCRGYGLKCWTIWQDMAQLVANYPDDWETLMNNCGVLQFFGCKNFKVARKIEDFTGVPANEIRQLTDTEQLVLIDSQPIFSKRMDYLTDPQFAGRFDANPLHLRSRMNGKSAGSGM